MTELQTGGAGSAPTLTPGTITGTSGQVYRATNLLTELTTRQKNAARECLDAVMPMVLMGVKMVQDAFARGGFDAETGKLDLDKGIISDLIKSLDAEAVFNALVMDDLDLKLLAVLYLPEGEPGKVRYFHKEAVAERADDLIDLTYGEKLQAFTGFFTMNFSFSPKASQGFLEALMKPKEPKNSSDGDTQSPRLGIM